MTAIYGAAGTDGRQLAWPLLDEAVRLYWGWPSLPPVDRSPRGKPLFRGREDRWFSLSHSGGLALCALSGAPVGVVTRSRWSAPGGRACPSGCSAGKSWPGTTAPGRTFTASGP